MKKIILILGIACVIFTACDKDNNKDDNGGNNNNENNNPTTTKLVKTITMTDNWRGDFQKTVYEFSYDEKSRIKEMTGVFTGGDEDGKSLLQFIYSDATIVIKSFDDGEFVADVIAYMNNGAINYFEDFHGSGKSTYTCTYANGYLSRFSDYLNVGNSVACAWDNGNMVKLARENDNYTNYYTAIQYGKPDYLNKANIDFNWLVFKDEISSFMDINLYSMLGLSGKQSKNLATKTTTVIDRKEEDYHETYGYEFDYTFDNDGNATGFTIYASSYTVNGEIEYE